MTLFFDMSSGQNNSKSGDPPALGLAYLSPAWDQRAAELIPPAGTAVSKPEGYHLSRLRYRKPTASGDLYDGSNCVSVVASNGNYIFSGEVLSTICNAKS